MDQSDHGISGSGNKGASSLSVFRQHFPSCQIHPVVELHDVDSETPATISAAAETMPATESADDMPVRVPLQLGFSLLRSLSDTAPAPVSDPPSPSDAACSVLLAYLSHNLRLPVNSATFRYPQPLHRSRFMYIDAHASRALELTRAQDASGYIGAGGGSDGSVLRQLDKTATAGGSRCLQAWLLRPLVDIGPIVSRQDAVECFVMRPALRRQVRDALEGVGDMQRCMQKMLLNRACPLDAVSLARSLRHTLRLQSTLMDACCGPNGSSLAVAVIKTTPR
jgi:DNA mismatch repair ATPase MutS